MSSHPARFLVVVADDFGIGPSTSRGVLDVAETGAVTAAVLLVNTPFAESDVRAWRKRGCPLELGWHPNLTLDVPVAGSTLVPSLVGPEGKFLHLGAFVRRWLAGRINPADVERELTAQLERFVELVGHLPTVVNTHQHLGVFAPVGDILVRTLQKRRCFPYVRRVREPWNTLWSVPGARVKRAILNLHGRRAAASIEAQAFPGNDWLAGITDPKWVKKPEYFEQWLRAMPGEVVELMVHPGYLDATLLGRDCNIGDGLLERRVDEMRLLRQPEFLDAVRAAGFRLLAPSQLALTGACHVDAA